MQSATPCSAVFPEAGALVDTTSMYTQPAELMSYTVIEKFFFFCDDVAHLSSKATLLGPKILCRSATSREISFFFHPHGPVVEMKSS